MVVAVVVVVVVVVADVSNFEAVYDFNVFISDLSSFIDKVNSFTFRDSL